MDVLVTGAFGQLGSDVMTELKLRNHNAIGVGVEEMNITDYELVRKTITTVKPDIVIHCAAWTNVDGAETSELSKIINGDATLNVARACEAIDCKMMYVSTDYVFGEMGDTPIPDNYRNYNPLNAYGLGKCAGEKSVISVVKKHFVVRTSWVFGKNGKNFVDTMIKLSKTKDCVKVVSDQIGTPTYSRDLARLMVDIAETERYGVYNATNEGGYISWYDFAVEIFRQIGSDIKVIPVTSEEYGAIAERPKNSRLIKSLLRRRSFQPLPDWKDALSRYLKEIGVESVESN